MTRGQAGSEKENAGNTAPIESSSCVLSLDGKRVQQEVILFNL